MNHKLLYIRILHTIIWLFLSSVIFYILCSGFLNTVTIFTWIAIGLVILEGLVLLLYGGSCPLTGIARKYSDSKKDNFDIFLPEWLAKHNKTIFGILFTIGLMLVLYRSIQ